MPIFISWVIVHSCVFFLFSHIILNHIFSFCIFEWSIIVISSGYIDDVIQAEFSQILIERYLNEVIFLFDIFHVVSNIIIFYKRSKVVGIELVVLVHFWLWFLWFFNNFYNITTDLVLSVGVYMCVENSQTVNIANVWRNPSQIFNLFLVGNTFLEDCLAFTFKFSKKIENKLIQIFYCQFRILTELFFIMFNNVLGLHIQLVYLCTLQEITELWFFLLGIELIFCGILTGWDKYDSLIERH